MASTDAAAKMEDLDAIAMLSSVYGLDVEPASIKPLPSYDDQNIFFKTVSGAAYVLKVHNIAKTGQSVSNLEAQNHAISTLVSAGINCPRVVAKTSLSDVAVDAASGSIDAADAAAVAEDTPATASAFCHVLPGGGRVCRVLQFVHGRMFVDVPDPKPLELFRALGRYLGQLDLALKDFSHPGAVPPAEMLWNGVNSHLAPAKYAHEIESPEDRALVERNAAYFTAVISPALASLPTAVIHSDANDYNVIVAPESLEIAGVIDFGDLMLTARVCELGNCIGYAILDKDDIVEVAAQIAAAYLAVHPQDESEWSLALAMGIFRLGVSVTMSNHSHRLEPENEYLLVTSKPGWRTLWKVEHDLGGVERAQRLFVARVKELLSP